MLILTGEEKRILLRTESEDEKKIVNWFVENFGVEDTREVLLWVWQRERDAKNYVRALYKIGEVIKSREAAEGVSGREAFSPFLEHARKPRGDRELAEQVMAVMQPLVDKARIQIFGHRGDPAAVEGEIRMLRVRLREECRRLWPRAHRATIDGAIVSATQVRGGAGLIDFVKLVELLSGPDALSETAEASHGVSNDR